MISASMLTLEDFQNRWESFDQYVTLSCISGRIGTSLISTTQWTGVSVQDVLAELDLQEGAKRNIISLILKEVHKVNNGIQID